MEIGNTSIDFALLYADSIQKLVETLQSTNEEYKKFMSKADSDWGKQDFSNYSINLENSTRLITELPDKARVYLEDIETAKRENYEYWLEYYARLARKAIAHITKRYMQEETLRHRAERA